MKALKIDPETKSIEEIEITNHDDIVKLIGFETVISDEIGPGGDHLFFDEECFLRGSSGRFQIDSIIPVSGVGIVMGASVDGARLHDVSSNIESLSSRTRYL